MIVAVALISLSAMLPAFVQHDTVGGDMFYASNWQAHYADAIQLTDPYPRWLRGINEGFGSPAFFIYPPLSQIVATLFLPFLPGPAQAVARLLCCILLLFGLSGVGAWAWLRALGKARTSALIGALAYILLPYHLYVDVYERGAVAEQCAMAALPFLMLTATRLADSRRNDISAHALTTALMLASHAPLSLFCIPFALAFGLLRAPRRDIMRIGVRLGVASALGTLCAAAYLSTAFTHLANIHSAVLFEFYIQPKNFLLLDAPWADLRLMRVIELICVLHTIVAGAAILSWRGKRGSINNGSLALAVFSLILTIGMTRASAAFWALDTPLNRIQFPWRMLGLQSLLTALLIADLLLVLRHRLLRNTVGIIAIAGLLLANLGLVYLRYNYGEFIPLSQQFGSSRDAAEYQLGSIAAARHVMGPRAIRPAARAAVCSVGTMRQRTQEADCRTMQSTTITLGQLIYPGWRYRIDGGPWQAVRPLSREVPLITARVPAGKHHITFDLERGPTEIVGLIGSGFGFAIVAGLFGMTALTRRRRIGLNERAD